MQDAVTIEITAPLHVELNGGIPTDNQTPLSTVFDGDRVCCTTPGAVLSGAGPNAPSHGKSDGAKSDGAQDPTWTRRTRVACPTKESRNGLANLFSCY